MLCFLNCKENICAFKNYPPKCSDRSSFDGRGENWKVSHGHTSGATFFFKVFTFCCTFLLATLQVMLFKIMFCFCVTVVSPSKQWFRGKEEPLGKNFLHMLKKSFKFCPGRVLLSQGWYKEQPQKVEKCVLQQLPKSGERKFQVP